MFIFENISEQEANMILTGLAELPAKHSMPLIQKLQVQATEQIQLAKKRAEAEANAPSVEGEDK